METVTSNEVKIGAWTYHPETLVVSYGLDEYEVDLEQCSTSAGMLDWIFQFRSKSWATSEAVGDLVMILHRLLHPQGSLCSRGVEGEPFPKGDALRKLIAKRIREMEVFNQWVESMSEKNGDSDGVAGSSALQKLKQDRHSPR